MNSDNKQILSNMTIYDNFPRSRLNTWISNMNVVAQRTGISTMTEENRDFIYADKIQTLINLMKSFCNKSGTIPRKKYIGIDDHGDPIYEITYRSCYSIISGNAVKGEPIYAALFDSIRGTYNNIVDWYNWFTEFENSES